MKILIKADFGTFSSIESAALSENIIDWWNDKDIRRRICTQCFAAWEIYGHLEKAGIKVKLEGDSTGYDVLIMLGKSIIRKEKYEIPVIEQGCDGLFRSCVEAGKRIVMIFGNDGHGTLRSAYSWLESLGFHWYTPDKFGSIYPETLVIGDAFEMQRYDYKTRGCYNEFIDDENTGLIKWASRNRMNMIRVNKFNNPHSVKKRGLQIMSGGHEIFYNHLNPKSIYPNGEQKTYFEVHPEWFALIDGKRSSRDENKNADEGYYTGDNICTSNLSGVKVLAKGILNSINNGDYKHCDYLNIWAYDNGTWCECENCRKTGNLSRRMLMLAFEINKILKYGYEKGETGRRIKLVVPVYHETLEPPDKPLPSDFDYEHIIATFFPIERCYAHNIDDKNCTESNVQLKNLYEKWFSEGKGTYKGEMFIGEYYNVSSFASLPFVFSSRIVNDLPYYFKTGTKHFYYMHISAVNWGMLALNNCLIAGFLRNISFDSNAFLNEFYSECFPETGKDMEKFHTVLERISLNMKYLKHYQFSENGDKISLFTEIDKTRKFTLKHCKFDYREDDVNASLSFTETMEGFVEAEKILNKILKIASGIEKERIEIEKMRFYYGFYVMKFIFAYVKLRKAYKTGENKKAVRLFYETEKLREKLLTIKKPLIEMKYECPWYENAYSATWHKNSYEKFRTDLKHSVIFHDIIFP